MIHVAFLFHDNVVDKSDFRRDAPSAPAAFDNKFSVFGGDFLLGRATAALSRLGDNEVVELLSTVFANLAEGEVLQTKEMDVGPSIASPPPSHSSLSDEVDFSSLHAQPLHAEGPHPDRWCTYLKRTYLKTASLMVKGARAAVVLGGCREGEIWKEVAYAYGRNVGIAFQVRCPSFGNDPFSSYEPTRSQLVDDILGKPDLRLGLATGPILYAAEEYPELEPLIARRFKHDGDVEQVGLLHDCCFPFANEGFSHTLG